MDYTIPTTVEEILALRKHPVNAELLAAAMAGLVQMARRSGKSLEELTAEVLEEAHVKLTHPIYLNLAIIVVSSQ
ncbi:MAG: hypothetical protein GDA44_12965 [Prochloron sp. SP5CPC1]|nr:hypothetical protein [Candidatus Paraprochloron terpiosi SP5CPC1]